MPIDFLRSFVQLICQMQQDIAVEGVRRSLYPPLCIDGLGHIAQLVQQVVAVQHHDELAVVEGAGKRGVPAPFACVQFLIGISSSQEVRHAGLKPKLVWQLQVERQGGLVV